MEDNNLILAWDNFELSTLNTLKDQFNNKNFTDITLVTNDNQQINAHMAILISASEVFQNCIPKQCCLNPFIVLIDLPYKYLKLVMQFIYTGKCVVKEEDILEVLDTGKVLGVNCLITDLTIENNGEYLNTDNSKP